MDKNELNKMGFTCLAIMIITPIALGIRKVIEKPILLIPVILIVLGIIALIFGVFCLVIFLNSFIRNYRHKKYYGSHKKKHSS